MSSQTSPKAQAIVAVLILALSVSLYLWPNEQNEQLEDTISKDLSQALGKRLPLLEKQISQSFFEEQTEIDEEKITDEKDTREQTKEELTQENIISDTSEKNITTDEIKSSALETKEENAEIKPNEIKGLKTLTALFSLTRAVVTSQACGGGSITIPGIRGRLTTARCCGRCCDSDCDERGCSGKCGEGVAYLWDSNTQICGCGT